MYTDSRKNIKERNNLTGIRIFQYMNLEYKNHVWKMILQYTKCLFYRGKIHRS